MKSEIAAEISALLAFSAIKNNDRVGAILFTDHVEKFIPPRRGSTHVLRVIREVLFYKPAGFNNDVVIGSTHHGGEEYTVVFNAGSPLAAVWDGPTQTLTVTIPSTATQTALDLVNTINAVTAADDDVEAALGYEGEDPVADLLDPEHYEPIGGDPPNSRGYGAGSCS